MKKIILSLILTLPLLTGCCGNSGCNSCWSNYGTTTVSCCGGLPWY